MGGTTLGPYRIIEAIGAGGMGEVYRAHDARLQRDVAVKILPSAQAGDEEARARLLREARAAAALNHPHICTIYEVGEADGQAYIAMEVVDGRPLDRVIPAGGLAVSDVLAYGLQIADAVAHAHDKGVLHRDLKAANIMVTTAKRVKVLSAAWGVLAAGMSNPGQREEAEAAISKGASINPALLGFERAMMQAAHGKTDEARAEIVKLEAQPPTPFSVWSLSQAHIALGNYDEAFKWLAHRPAHAFLPWIRVHPPFRPMRSDPRFAALMAEMRLPMP